MRVCVYLAHIFILALTHCTLPVRAALTDIAHLHFSFDVVPFADACRSHEYHTVLFHFPLIAFVDAHGSHESQVFISASIHCILPMHAIVIHITYLYFSFDFFAFG